MKLTARGGHDRVGSASAPIAVVREGNGPEVLLIHGGASPSTTWRPLMPLSARWTLVLAHRRGYPPSPAPARGRQDFETDAADIASLLDSRPHVVAHSYGGLGAVIATARRSASVRSLTLIEPPLCHLVPGDPEVERFRTIGEAVFTRGLGAEPAVLREFLLVAGATNIDEGPLPDAVASSVRRAHGARPPADLGSSLEAIRDARIPSLVVSGDHAPALERICDALAVALDSERLVAPGAGHFVAASPGFPQRLDRFMLMADELATRAARRSSPRPGRRRRTSSPARPGDRLSPSR